MNLSMEHLEILLDRMADAVVAIDKKGRITIVNHKAEMLLGLRKEDYMTMRIDQVIEGSELLRVVDAGIEEINMRFSLGDRQFLVDRLPVRKKGSVEGAIAIFHDVTPVYDIRKKWEEDKCYIESLDTIIDTCSERIVLTDEKGIIKLMSNSYKQLLGVENPEGKHVKEVIENTRLPIVLETGAAEIGDIQMLKGHKMIAMRMPIRKNGVIVGAIGKVMFKDISELLSLSKKSTMLEAELKLGDSFEKERTAKYSFKNLVGYSDAINAAKQLAMKVAKTDSNILVTGESGTGKELFVHAIHNASLRRNQPFVKINCAAIPSELLESELFGYEEGAFTGARRGGKTGKFLLADGGTLLLDEIGDMPLEMQAKLLRVIQEKEVEKVGGEEVQHVDVRIIAATNQDLASMVKENTFRQDLYYRLNVVHIKLPSLKERLEDIPILMRELSYIIGNRLGICVEGISDEVKSIFMKYAWPGNIRELENVIEHAINLLDSDGIIRPEHLPEHMQEMSEVSVSDSTFQMFPTGSRVYDLKEHVERMEIELIKSCLKDVDYNKKRAAEMLNISRVSLYKKIEKYKIDA